MQDNNHTAVIIGSLLIVLGLVVLMAKSNSKEQLLTVGIISPLSGEVASMGEGIVNSIGLIAKDSHLRFVFQDDQCDTKKAVSAYQILKLQKVKIFYVACSGSVIALAPLAKDNHDLIITAYAGSAEIRKTGTEVIRFIPDALSVVDAIKEYVQAQSENLTTGPHFGLLYEEQDYAKSVADNIKNVLGSQLVIAESYRSSENQFQTQITKIKASGVDTLIFIPTSDKAAQLVLRQMKTLSFSPFLIGEVNVCDYPFRPSDFGIHGVCWKAGLTTGGFKKFTEQYKTAYGKDSQYPFYDAITYDSMSIVSKLLLQGKDVESIRQAILKGQHGDVADYTFEPNGEVVGKKYLRQINF